MFATKDSHARRPGRLLAALLPAQLASCASVEPLVPPHPVGLPMPAEIAERFDYEAGAVRAELSLVREESAYRVFEGAFPPDIDRRIAASAVALVAGDLPFVLSNSSERRIVEAADGAMDALHTDREGLRQYLEARVGAYASKPDS